MPPDSPPDSPYATVWTEPFRVRAYEAGPDDRAGLLAVLNLFQEAAGEQAAAHRLDVFELPAGPATWVLSRLRAVVCGPLPRARDAVTVDTWPSDRDGLRAHRDFVLRDAAGAALVRATSVWFLLDVARRRPVRLPPAMDRFLPPPDVPRGLTLAGAPAPAAPAAPARCERFAVRHADHDRVGHANHVRIAEWAIEAVPERVRAAARLSALDVAFHAEATAGQAVVSACGPEPGTAGGATALAHHVFREAAGDAAGSAPAQTVALARTLWT